jgi:ABC-2 type transport system permease protein
VAAVLGKAARTGVAAGLLELTPALGFAFLGVALWVWRFGVRHYTSTGS